MRGESRVYRRSIGHIPWSGSNFNIAVLAHLDQAKSSPDQIPKKQSRKAKEERKVSVMSKSRRRKKVFPCDHKGFGQYCHRCNPDGSIKVEEKIGRGNMITVIATPLIPFPKGLFFFPTEDTEN